MRMGGAKALIWPCYLQVFGESVMLGNEVPLPVGLSVLKNLLEFILHNWPRKQYPVSVHLSIRTPVTI